MKNIVPKLKWKRINKTTICANGEFLKYTIYSSSTKTNKKFYYIKSRFASILTGFKKLKDAKKVIKMIERG